MATTLFFPPPSALPCSHNGSPLVPSEEDDNRSLSPLSPLRETADDELDDRQTLSVAIVDSTQESEVVVEDDQDHCIVHKEIMTKDGEESHEVEVEAEEEEEVVVENVTDESVQGIRVPSIEPVPDNLPEIAPMDIVEPQVGTGRRVTLKPRRTLSLSPTPARSGDMMGSNLRAARWLDFTNEDDDDGLYQASDSDSEGKRKSAILDEPFSGSSSSFGKMRTTRRGRSLTLGAMTVGLNKEFGPSHRSTFSVKRPLEVTLPCQEIQYLDISYQNVGIHSVQFSPIPRKKIAYHPVPYHAIHYCDVPYLGERPMKRKPPA